MDANTDFERLFDYDVTDSGGARIGDVDHLWLDHVTGLPKYIGARTGWLMAHTYVIPYQAVQLDDEHHLIRLPYTADFVQHAPTLSGSADLTPEDEQKLSEYYQTAAGSGGFTAAPPPGSPSPNSPSPNPPPVNAPAYAAPAPPPPNASYATVPPPPAPPMAPQPMAVSPAPIMAQAPAPQAPMAPMAPAAQAQPAPTDANVMEAGRVQLRKVVRTERIYVPVEVQREYVEAVPGAPGTAASQPSGMAPPPPAPPAPSAMARQSDAVSGSQPASAVRDDRTR